MMRLRKHTGQDRKRGYSEVYERKYLYTPVQFLAFRNDC
jgi:hypothetical protein